jgi:hypothetical protein
MTKRWILKAMAGIATAAPVIALASTLFGTITVNGGPAGNRPLTVACPNLPPVPITTDRAGSYRVVINFTGRCTLQVDPPNGPSTTVVFHPDGTRYDFDLSQGALRRR